MMMVTKNDREIAYCVCEINMSINVDSSPCLPSTITPAKPCWSVIAVMACEGGRLPCSGGSRCSTEKAQGQAQKVPLSPIHTHTHTHTPEKDVKVTPNFIFTDEI